MDNLKNRWREAKSAVVQPLEPVKAIIAKARKKKRSILYFHYGNVLVLTATLLVLVYFFYRVVDLKTTLSKVGMDLMLGGLILRILIEVYSSIKSKTMGVTKDAAHTIQAAHSFYLFRRKVHGPVTFTTVGLYAVGFYFLSPEFSANLSFKVMLLIHLSFIIGAVLLIWQIRKGIQNELYNLRCLQNLEVQINEAYP
jgi:hypothetical protein